MKVYLSGRIDDLTKEEASAPRRRATRILTAAGHTVLDPMRGETDHIRNQTVITDERRRRHGLSDAAIVARDIKDLEACDAVLNVTASHPSHGTDAEWGIAGYLRKPYVAVDPEHSAQNHPWCRRHCAAFFDTVEDACKFLIEFFGV